MFRGLETTRYPAKADLIFVSHDTPTNSKGKRDLKPIIKYLDYARRFQKPIVLTSQVPPGFTGRLPIKAIWHQAETLRISDARQKARYPEQIIVGGPDPLPAAYVKYLHAFECPILRMSWEEAEFAKIAINMTLASQVENTNRLSKAAEKVGAKWENVCKALSLDKRIGKDSYLTPGRWQNSPHLMRDHVTLKEIECRTS